MYKIIVLHLIQLISFATLNFEMLQNIDTSIPRNRSVLKSMGQIAKILSQAMKSRHDFDAELKISAKEPNFESLILSRLRVLRLTQNLRS